MIFNLSRRELYGSEIHVEYHTTHNYMMQAPHFHDGYEINVTLSDDVQFFIENRKYFLKAGTMTIINNEERHFNVARPNTLYERYIISFQPEFLSDFILNKEEYLEHFIYRSDDFSHCMRMNKEQLAEFRRLADSLYEIERTQSYAWDIKMKLALTEILLLSKELYAVRESANAILQTNSHKRIQPIIEFIHDHINERLPLDFICSVFYISKTHLIQLFKEAIGMTPNEYIISMRIVKARDYLKSGVPVSKVCELVGYSDESHFIRTFKSVLGITPKQYSLKQNK